MEEGKDANPESTTDTSAEAPAKSGGGPILLQRLSEGGKSSPGVAMPVVLAIAFAALFLGFIISALLNIQLDFGDSKSNGEQRNRVIVTPPMIRFIPKDSNSMQPQRASAQSAPQLPPPTTVSQQPSPSQSPAGPQQSVTRADNQPGAPDDLSSRPAEKPTAKQAPMAKQASSDTPDGAAPPTDQPASNATGAATASVPSKQLPLQPRRPDTTIAKASLRPRQAYQMNAIPSSSPNPRPRHAYEMKQLGPAAPLRHAYHAPN